MVRAWDRPIHVVHFYAHIDYTPFRHGFMYTNVQPMRHIRKMPHVQTLTQVGIRSLRNRGSDVHDSIGDGNRVIAMEEFRDRGPRDIAAVLPANAAVYVSIDIDVNRRGGGAWWNNPMWIAIGVIGLVLLVVIVAMIARGGGTTVIKE